MFYYVYVLQSKKDKRWYTGFTNDIRKRLTQHNMNQSQWTKNRGPFALIYCKMCLDRDDARSREVYLKTGMGKRYLKNRMGRFLSLTG